MTKKQFKHEPDGYIPILPNEGSKKRPWWLHDDEVLLYFYDDDGNLDFKIKKIKNLTKEEIKKCKDEGII